MQLLLRKPLIKSHMAAHCISQMGYKASEAVNGWLLHNELNAAVRLQNFPPGLPISSLCHKHIYMIPGKDKSLHVEVNF